MKHFLRIQILFLVIGNLFSTGGVAQQFPFQNPALSAEQRAGDLITRLTLEEKASLMFDQSPAIPRLGIKKFNWWSEALHGLANNKDVTVFPEPIGMAASFDDSLVFKIFNATSDEVRAKYHDALKNGVKTADFSVFQCGHPTLIYFVIRVGAGVRKLMVKILT